MKLRIPVRLSLWISGTLILFLLLVGLLLSVRWLAGMKNTMHEYAKTSVREIANDLDKLFVQVDMAADLVATSLEHHPPVSPEEVKEFLESLALGMYQQCPEIIAFAILWEKDQLVPGETYNAFIGTLRDGKYKFIHWNDRNPFDYFSRDWYTAPAHSQKPVWTVAYSSDANAGVPVLSYEVPFFRTDKSGARVLAGIVDVDLPVASFNRYLHTLNGSEAVTLPDTTETFLVNQYGRITCSPARPDNMNKTIFSLCEEQGNPSPADRENVRNVLRAGTGMTVFENAAFLGRETRGCELYHASCVNGWIVATAVPRDWTFQNILPSAVRLGLFTLFFLAVITGIIFSVCSRITRPLGTLSIMAAEAGKGNFSAPVPEFDSGDEIATLASSFRRMQTELSSYIEKLRESVAARERAEGELNAAKSIQQNLLPDELPPYPFCPGVSAAAFLIPAHGVGGDLYDIYPLDDGKRIAFLIGDVSGKGIPAALFMSAAQTLQRTLAPADSDSPAELTTALNAALSARNGAGMFITSWTGFLNTETGELSFTCAGHNPPVIRRRDGSAEFLRKLHGPPLASLENISYRSDSILLQSGDTVLLYTDGVTEAFARDGKTMFGSERLLNAVKETSPNSPEALISSVCSAVQAFSEGAEQADDITMLAVSFSKPERTADQSAVFKATSDQLPKGNAFLESSVLFQKLSPADQTRLAVSFEEIFVNVASYAYPPGKDGSLRIDIFEKDGEIRLRFTDTGKPFDPLKHTDPDITLSAEDRPVGGLGIFLVRKNSSSVSYERTPDGENVLTIGMKLPS